MNRNSPDRRPGRGETRPDGPRPRDRARSPSSSRSPPARSRNNKDNYESQSGGHRSRNNDSSKRRYNRDSHRSTRSRSPKPRRRRARSRSSEEEQRHHSPKRSLNEAREEQRRPRHDDTRKDRRHQEYESSHHRDHRHRERSREHNGSTRQSLHSRTDGRARSYDDQPTQAADRREPGQDQVVAAVEKEQPNYGRSGKLAAETNQVEGTKIVLKYHEPSDARLPSSKSDWRMYEFKGKETMSTTELSKRSCWLVGREEAVVDFHVAHPSCSSQHAVLQFRFVEKKNEFGERVGKVKLYVLDLESSNGTSLNGERIEDRRFIEVRNGDVIRFGESTREYVILLA